MFCNSMFLATCSLIDDYKYGRVAAINSLRSIVKRRSADPCADLQTCQVKQQSSYEDCNGCVSELSEFPEAVAINKIRLNRILKKFKVTFDEVDVSTGDLFGDQWYDGYEIDNHFEKVEVSSTLLKEEKGVVRPISFKVKRNVQVLDEKEEEWYTPYPKVEVVEPRKKSVIEILTYAGTPLCVDLVTCILQRKVTKDMINNHFGDYFEDILRRQSMFREKAEGQINFENIVPATLNNKIRDTLDTITKGVNTSSAEASDFFGKTDAKINFMAGGVDQVVTKANNVMDDVKGTTKVMNETLENVSNCAKQSSSTMKSLENMFTTVRSVFGGALKNFNMVTLILNNFAFVCINPTPKTLALCAISTINMCLQIYFKFSLCTTVLMDVFVKLSFAYMMGPRDDRAEAQIDIDGLTVYAGELARVLKVESGHIANMVSLARNIFVETGKLAASGNQISRFVRDHLTYFERVIYYISNSCYNHNKLMNVFANLDGRKALQTFVRTVEILCDPAHFGKVMHDPFWTNLAYRTKALSIVINCTLLDEADKRAISIVAPYIKRLDELFNQIRHNKVNSPAGYEPYYLYMFGDTGIGKSYSVDGIIIEMLKAANIKFNGDPVYTRSPGMPYWNCLNGEPCCKFDDFLQITADDTSAGEIYGLKTAAKFNPPIAKLEDKHTIYNPLILACCANNGFPKAKVSDMKSFYARRNILIKCHYVPKDDGATRIKIDSYTGEELKNYDHLQFTTYKDPADEKTEESKMYSYKEIVDYLVEDFKKYTVREELNYNERMKRFSVLADPTADADKISFMLDEAATDLQNSIDQLKKNARIPIAERTNKPVNASFTQCLKEVKAVAQSDLEDVVDVIQDNEDDETNVGNLFGDLGSRASTSEERESKIHPSQEILKDILVPGVDMSDLKVGEPFGFPTYYVGVEHNISVVDKDSFPTSLPFCLHQLKSDDYGEVLYDSSNDSIIKGTLEFSPKPCQYAVGKSVKDLPNCIIRKKKTREEYFARLNVENIKFYQDIGSSSYIPFEDEHSNEGEAVNRFTSLMKKILKRIKEVFIKLEVRDEDSKGMRFLKKVYIDIRRITNAVIKEILSFWADWSKIILAVSLGLVCLFGCRFVSMFSWFGNKCIPQGSGSGKTYDSGRSYKAKVQKVRYGQHKVFKSYHNANAQSLIMREQTKPIINNVLSNMFFIVYEGDNVTYKGRCLGTHQHCAIMPFHYAEAFTKSMTSNDGSFYLINSKGIKLYLSDVSFLNSVERIYDDSGIETGLCKFTVPKSIGLFRDIRSMIFTGQTELPAKCIFSTIYDEKLNIIRETSFLDLTHNFEVTVDDGEGYSSWKVSNGFAYSKQSKGLCGSIILAEFRDGVKIIGMHTAGLTRSNLGISEPLFKNYVCDEQESVPIDMEEFSVFDMEDDEKARCQIDTFVSKISFVPNRFRTAQSRKTQIVPSLIQGVYPIHTEPAVLDPNDSRLDGSLHSQGFVDPMFCGTRKRGLVPTLFSSHVVKLCVENLKTKLMQEMVPMRSKVGKLSIPQAVNGLNLVGYDKMDLTTSEGYPWILERPKGFTNKKWLFEVDDSEVVCRIKSQLQQRVKDANELREQRIIPYTVFNACLKDERKKISKIPIPGKTRVFELSPVDATISHRMYTQDFVAAFTASRFKSEHAIGINVDSYEWAQLYNHLTEFSSDIIYADYSDFGPTLNFDCVYGAIDIINSWYKLNGEQNNELNSNARNCIGYELGQCREICNDLLFQTHCGLPSGCTLTTYLNSLVNSIYIRYMFVILSRFYKTGISILDFDKYIRLVVYGDDLLISVKRSIVSWFNGHSLSDAFKEFGITFTNFSSNESGVSHIGEVSFLKRKFYNYRYKNKNYMLAPLEYDVVTEIANWIHVSENVVLSTIENSEASVRSMFGHGELEYEKHRKRIITALMANSIRAGGQFPSWVELFSSTYEVEDYIPLYERAQGQMDEGVQGSETTPQAIESSNVVIQTQRVSDESSTSIVNNMYEYCAASEKTNFQNLCDRWFAFAHIRWGSQARGTVLGSWTLPKDPIVSGVGTTSNFLPFSMWQYVKCDLEIRVEVNSNKFQVGQLQFSFYYGGNEDLNFKVLRENVYNASQRMHSLVSAGSSNPVHLYIPFKCPTAYLSCRTMNRYFTHDILSLGTLSCIVLNPLNTPSGTYGHADVNVFMTFKNIEFTGMRNVNSQLTAEAQIFGAIVSGARIISGIANVLSNVSDKECDKPLAPSPPSLLIPTATNSFSYTGGIAEQYPTMRAIPMAQTPTITESDQMDIDYVIAKYGLVTHFTWEYGNANGVVLATYPAHPIWDLSCYMSKEHQSSTVYYLPPVSVVASLFSLWRGELEFRFDVVASTFHTGKLLIAYIPGAVMSDKITIDQAKSSPNLIYDLSENRQCTLEVPYVSNKPFWPRGLSLKHHKQERAPGIIKVFVLNTLVPMDSVVGEIEVNVYMRGIPGKFEVAIPIAPAVGLSFNSHITRNTATRASTIYSPFYSTYYVYLSGSRLTLFYSATAGKYVTFTNLKFDKVYSLKKCYQGKKSFDLRVPYYNPRKTIEYAEYMVRGKVNWQSAVVLLFSNIDSATDYMRNGGPEKAIKYVDDGPWASIKKEGESEWIRMPAGYVEFEPVTQITDDDPEAGPSGSDSGYSLRTRATGQVDDVNPPIKLLQNSRSTNFGLLTFGESVTSLKALGKRYNNYVRFVLRRQYTSIIPIVFDRLDLDLSEHDNADNLYRDGTLPIILSGYRFVRGGLRFKLLLVRGLPRSTNIIVMFDPEYKDVTRSVVVEPVCLTANYPTIVQCTRVNEILEFEIPYYRAGQYNYLQKPNIKIDDNMAEFSSLGALRIVTTSPESLECGLFYSLADDTMFDEFVGFPPMLTLNQVADT